MNTLAHTDFIINAHPNIFVAWMEEGALLPLQAFLKFRDYLDEAIDSFDARGYSVLI